MTFTEHLRELRQRLIVSCATVGILALVLFWPSQFVIPWLTQLYFPHTVLHAFGPADAIIVEFKFSIYGAIVLGLPVIVYEIWMFIVPAIHPRTRRVVYWYTLPSLVLAAAGVAFCHFFVIRRVVAALLAITNQVATPTFGLQSTLNLILLMFLGFALVFQTPMVMIALARIGLINSQLLRRYRKYAIMLILLTGGLLAPDASPITMMLLATPMYVLFEASIWIIVMLEKSWQAQALSS
jgi:sec-independent protein translocase protein TatC